MHMKTSYIINHFLGTFLFFAIIFISTGLDSGRYQWSPDFHRSIYLLGIILTAAGQLVFLIAQSRINFLKYRQNTNRQRTFCL
jgi:hypothetical protein